MTTRLRTTVLTSLALAAPATAGDDPAGVDPYSRANGTWISIDGTVDAVTADAFVLDYGNGSISVEMDDGDRENEDHAQRTG